MYENAPTKYILNVVYTHKDADFFFLNATTILATMVTRLNYNQNEVIKST